MRQVAKKTGCKSVFQLQLWALCFAFPAMDVSLVWTGADVQSDDRIAGPVIMTAVTSLQGKLTKRPAAPSTDSLTLRDEVADTEKFDWP